MKDKNNYGQNGSINTWNNHLKYNLIPPQNICYWIKLLLK